MSCLDENSDKVVPEKANLEGILSVLEEFQKDTSQQLIRVGRRINVLEKRVLPSGSFEGDDLESDNIDEDNASTDAYGFDEFAHNRRRRLTKRKSSTAPPLNSARKVRTDNGGNSGFAAIQSDDLQTEFQSIREGVARQRLPKDLKFNSSVKGIKAQSRDVA